jgi:hypothetical protein
MLVESRRSHLLSACRAAITAAHAASKPGRRKKSHVPTSESMRAGPRRGMVAGLPPRDMRCDERKVTPRRSVSRKTGVYYCD